MISYPEPPEGLVIERDGVVLRLRLDRPERRNALTDDIVLALADATEAAGADDSVRVIELTGTGDHFCSGFDLALRRGGRRDGSVDRPPRVGATQRRMRNQVNRLIPAMLETQTPIVVAARGWVAGLGLNLVLASDFAVVSDDARLWSPFTGFGFTPDSGASWLIPRLVGTARAKEMLMLSRPVSGRQAADWGLVHQSVPTDQVAAATRELVDELAGSATVAVGLTKLLVQRSLAAPLDQHLADEAFALEVSTRSEDFEEYVRSRREHREPDYRGR